MTRTFLRAAPLLLLLASPWNAGCSAQGEGERCSILSTDDCDTGLVCTSHETLKSNADLCCPPSGQAPNVLSCIPGIGATSNGGAAGAAGASGAGTTAGAAGVIGGTSGVAGQSGSG